MTDEKVRESRRDFLKLAATGAPAVAVAAVAGGTSAEAAVPGGNADGKAAGLRKTEHVEKYLESARF